MWHVIKQERELGHPAVKTTVMPDSEEGDAQDCIDLAQSLADIAYESAGSSLSLRRLAENVFQFDTVYGTRVTYQAQPTSWRINRHGT